MAISAALNSVFIVLSARKLYAVYLGLKSTEATKFRSPVLERTLLKVEMLMLNMTFQMCAVSAFYKMHMIEFSGKQDFVYN